VGTDNESGHHVTLLLKNILFVTFITAAGLAQKPNREVAITIDDLPVAQSGPRACEYERLTGVTERLLSPIRQGHVPVTAFLIGGNCPKLSESERKAVLKLWTDAGAELGNHTYSHEGLNTAPIDAYEQDILRAEPVIRNANGGRPVRYFRSPMLQTGPDVAIKKRLESFLAGHGYQQAPVTFDNSDWMFAYVLQNAAFAARVRKEYVLYMESVISFFEKRSVQVVGREFPQVLLLHANELNAGMLPALLEMLRQRGYRFVSLEHALKDQAYRLPNEYAGTGGFSWIHRWSMTRGMAGKGEPDEPAWLRDAYKEMSRP
jgi:peptidoglycan/xylan/chitin deacetylase (PgdA/CDA1 family)